MNHTHTHYSRFIVIIKWITKLYVSYVPFIEPAVCDWMNHQPAVIMWADELQTNGSLWSHHPFTHSVPSVGKPMLNPDHHSEHNAPKRWLSHCLSHWSGFCLVTFFHWASSRQLNPLHQIRALLSTSPLFLLLSLNKGQSHINTQGSFSPCLFPEVASLPRGVLFVCSSVKEEAELSSRQGWTAGRGGEGGVKTWF